MTKLAPFRSQCPFCLAYVRMRRGGEFYEHRVFGGKRCRGAGRTRDEAKELKSGVGKLMGEGLTDGIPL